MHRVDWQIVIRRPVPEVAGKYATALHSPIYYEVWNALTGNFISKLAGSMSALAVKLTEPSASVWFPTSPGISHGALEGSGCFVQRFLITSARQ